VFRQSKLALPDIEPSGDESEGSERGDCELRADTEPGKLVPTVGRRVPTIGEMLETGVAVEKRNPLIFQRLAPVFHDGMSDASGDG